MRTILFWSVLILVTGQAFGHARLTHSEPAEGAGLPVGQGEVTLRFSEAIQPRFSDFVFHFLGEDRHGSISDDNRLVRPDPVYDEARQQVTVALSEDAPAGWYALDWEVLAVDGHATGGTLRFVLTP